MNCVLRTKIKCFGLKIQKICSKLSEAKLFCMSLTANVINDSASVHCLNNQLWIDLKGRSEVQEPYFLDWTPGLLGKFIKHFIISIRVAIPGTNWKLIKDVEWCVWVGQADFGCSGNADICWNHRGKPPYFVPKFTLTDKINTNNTFIIKNSEDFL